MICPQCKSYNQHVLDSRSKDAMVKRRRECYDCGERWTTYEISSRDYKALTRVQVLHPAVVKIAGREMLIGYFKTEEEVYNAVKRVYANI